MGSAPKHLTGSELAAIAQQTSRLKGMDTLGILTHLLKGYFDAMDIPNEDPVLRQCLASKYALSRDKFVESLLEPLTPLINSAKDIEASLVVLGNLKKPTLQLYTKEFAPKKEALAKHAEKRDSNLHDYDKATQERDRVIQMTINRLKDSLQQSIPIDLTKDQIIQNEFNRINKMKTELLFKLEQLFKEKTSIKESLVIIYNAINENIPPEQRKIGEATLTTGATTPRLNE